MKAKCIKSEHNYYCKITQGKEYEIKNEGYGIYLILDDNFHLFWADKNLFQPINIEENKIKFEDIVNSPIKGIKLNLSAEDYFNEVTIRKDTDHTIYIREDCGDAVAKVKPSEIPKLIEWLQKVNTYIEQNKIKPKEMTIEEIEKQLGHRIKIIGGEK
ncbi:TPA: hypothetical protein LA460_000134 [Clostridium botulinum]|nr:hypothetical protein [Clostridium botulinum]HBJ1652739.1 hypothetical protein [Clostridium botulinum]